MRLFGSGPGSDFGAKADLGKLTAAAGKRGSKARLRRRAFIDIFLLRASDEVLFSARSSF